MSQAESETHSLGRSAEHKDLGVLLFAGADPQTLSAYLDGLHPESRVAEVQGLHASGLQLLYERCEKAQPLVLDEFLPPAVPSGQTVRFSGINNLPLFRTFEKRFIRTKSGAIFGFNFQRLSALTGPGYFRVVQSGSELLFDYTALPMPGDVPADWPAVQPNHRGLSRFIYKNLHDFCRRVSSDVVIGHATRLGTPMGQYFALARRSTFAD